MPASRWNKTILELLKWFEDDPSLLDEVIFMPITTRVLNDDQEPQEESVPEIGEMEENIPSVLPILPLRGVVVYPQTAVPLTIGQPRSIRLVDDVVAGDERLIGLVASQDPELDTPEPKDSRVVSWTYDDEYGYAY